MIYLAHAIDRNKNTAQKVERLIEHIRHDYQGVVYIPSQAFNLVPKSTMGSDVTAIMNVNTCALVNSSCVVLEYEPGIESWGVPQEVMFAHNNEIPVFVKLFGGVSDYENLSIYLKGHVPKEDTFYSWQVLLDRVNALEGNDGQ